jgi:hypothetical protein
MDEDLHSFVMSLPFNSNCTQNTGYFSPTSLRVLREKVMDHLQARVHALVNQPMDSQTHGSSQSATAAGNKNQTNSSSSSSSSNNNNNNNNLATVGSSDNSDQHQQDGDVEETKEGETELYAYRWCHRYFSEHGTDGGDEVGADTNIRREALVARQNMEKYVNDKARESSKTRKRKRAGMKMLQQLGSDGYILDSALDTAGKAKKTSAVAASNSNKSKATKASAKKSKTAAVSSSSSASSRPTRQKGNATSTSRDEDEDNDEEDDDDGVKDEVVEYNNVQGFDIFDGDEEDQVNEAEDADHDEDDYDSDVYDD